MTVADIYRTMEYGPAPESARPALDWIAGYGGEFSLFIGGEWRRSADGSRFQTTNPAAGEALATVAQGGAQDIDAAVAAANKALPGWKALGGHGRARYLYAIARQVQKRSRLLAVLETLDNGKSIRETRDLDIPLAARHFYHHAGWAQLLESEFPGCAPVGVAGQIIPWNFPLLMLAWKIAPALAAGNTVVLKPAEFTPLTALAFAEICQDIGLPAGVVNIVTGDGTTGELLVRHPGVQKIAFTGSTEVGRSIREATAGTGKRLSLELGGKSPFIVFEDADLDSAIEGLVDAIWFNQGEVCCAGSRLLIQESVEETMLQRLRDRMENLRVGDPLDKATDIGAIVAEAQLEKIERLVREGKEEGARCWQPAGSLPTRGLFYPPTLITDAAPASAIAQVEIFGPVLVAMSFRTPAEAVELANNTRYGLAASIWTESINLALDMARKVKAGTVWINSTNLFDAASGFGGYRESGYGREGGREGIWEYLRDAVKSPDGPAQHTHARPQAAAQSAKGKANGKEASVPQPNRRQDAGEAATDSAVETSAETDETEVDGFLSHGTDAGNGILPSLPPIDRTPKLYIGGKQVRPDSGYSLSVVNARGQKLGQVGEGNRKDIRNAVEAARGAAAWAKMSAHGRAQVLYYLAENLEARRAEFSKVLAEMTEQTPGVAGREVDRSIERIFYYAAWADKYDGAVHHTAFPGMTLAVPEPLGVIGIGCPPDCPLLGFLSLVLPAIAMGNRVAAIPSEPHPLAATLLYQVLDTSDVPPGVVNIITGRHQPLIETLAGHDEVAAVWYWGDTGLGQQVERLSAGNLKQTWVQAEGALDWLDPEQGQGQKFLRHATQIKNIWIPFTDEVSW